MRTHQMSVFAQRQQTRFVRVELNAEHDVNNELVVRAVTPDVLVRCLAVNVQLTRE